MASVRFHWLWLLKVAIAGHCVATKRSRVTQTGRMKVLFRATVLFICDDLHYSIGDLGWKTPSHHEWLHQATNLYRHDVRALRWNSKRYPTGRRCLCSRGTGAGEDARSDRGSDQLRRWRMVPERARSRRVARWLRDRPTLLALQDARRMASASAALLSGSGRIGRSADPGSGPSCGASSSTARICASYSSPAPEEFPFRFAGSFPAIGCAVLAWLLA